MQGTKLQEADNSKKFMDASLARKLGVLEKELTDIQSDIEQRTLLHNVLANDIGAKIVACESEIRGFGGWNAESIYEKRISAFEKEISDFKRELRVEGLSYWRDTSRLRESMRRVLREIWQIQGRKAFLTDYLDKLTGIEW
ncbi:MAG: hypothetical protein FP824_06160 [Euryarchaeota archaeon]|nr:hypothetical protein [Euryarchaeota archaeon]MBU4032945.1 hypothetical protein [Candidatus Thermoplasmatota archaeon]MBU4144245.1 hypothetical protein [Candidatus Thermoplasmatota archaeon]